MDADRPYWLGFSAFPGIGPLRFKLLLDYFGSAKAAWQAPRDELIRIGLGEVLTEKFDRFRRIFNLSGYAKRVAQLAVSILTIKDENYPKLLKEIPDPPFLLYVKGKFDLSTPEESLGNTSPSVTLAHYKTKQTKTGDLNVHLGGAMASPAVSGKRRDQPAIPEVSLAVKEEKWDINKSIAVVGTRRATSYGKEVTRRIVLGLVDAGITIVSGLALGIDAMAHRVAIEAGGKTIAVLGCGVDCCFPQSNQWLYDKIISGAGLVVSEFPISQRAARGLFPARNRIISGLSLGVIVTEGAEDSGALITARLATEQGREVFAVPGPITSPFSKAPSKLLKAGAKLVEVPEDVLSELNLGRRKTAVSSAKLEGVSGDENIILSILRGENLTMDEIIWKLSWETAKVIGVLSMLEIRGIVKNEGGVYSLNC